jgi:uncharacterized membrane protein
MGFWFFMFAMVAILPLAMIVIGIIFYNRPPKNINFIFGYRTDLSMKNQKTWAFAHHLLGKIWMIMGSILLPIMCVPMFFVINESVSVIGTLGAVLASISIFPLVISIFPVEKALEKNFDDNGKEISKLNKND